MATCNKGSENEDEEIDSQNEKTIGFIDFYVSDTNLNCQKNLNWKDSNKVLSEERHKD